VLVTSPAWEDRSVVAANLAVALAQAGHSTVLVGADLRWGRVHELFSVENRGGLTRMLSRRTSAPPTARATAVRGLRVVPAGGSSPDPAALVQRPAWHTAISQLRRQADMVVIEAPPLLASADVEVLAEVADLILLVVDARRSTRAQLRTAARELDPLRGKLIGCVLDSTGRRQLLPRPPRPPEPLANGRSAPLPRREYESTRNQPAGAPSPAGGNGHVPASSGAALGDTRGDDQ
jgi:non-specific protein-tyrosine kinase